MLSAASAARSFVANTCDDGLRHYVKRLPPPDEVQSTESKRRSLEAHVGADLLLRCLVSAYCEVNAAIRSTPSSTSSSGNVRLRRM